jgi:hypothetical protein
MRLLFSENESDRVRGRTYLHTSDRSGGCRPTEPSVALALTSINACLGDTAIFNLGDSDCRLLSGSVARRAPGVGVERPERPPWGVGGRCAKGGVDERAKFGGVDESWNVGVLPRPGNLAPTCGGSCGCRFGELRADECPLRVGAVDWRSNAHVAPVECRSLLRS